ncbi:MAG: MarR family transcriptional regulator [Sphingobium sp.]|nr:MarR family transcriptional regulator [Sphingobium sp.]
MATNLPDTPHGDDAVYGTMLPDRETYPDPELSLTIRIVMAGRRWRALIDEQLRDKGHSASRMEAMASIAYSAAGTTQIQVAKRIGIEGPTLTRTLDMLEADGLVERLPDPRDRRNKHMRLTRAGYEALAEMFEITTRLRKQLLSGVPGSEIAGANRFLELLIDRIESGMCEPGDS